MHRTCGGAEHSPQSVLPAPGMMVAMSVVKINAIAVPPGAGPELEKRFAARARSVEQMPGFEDFQLLRPVEGEERYFVYTRWDSEESFQAWVNSQAFQPRPRQGRVGRRQAGVDRRPPARLRGRPARHQDGRRRRLIGF